MASAVPPVSATDEHVSELMDTVGLPPAEAIRHDQESALRREALLALAASELRAAASLLGASGNGPGREQGAHRLHRMAEYLEHAMLPPVPEPRDPRPGVEPGRPRLLVVDDDADTREALQLLLDPEYEVITAVDGQEALDTALTKHPDVILLDLNMPRLNGFQVLERLRADPATVDIPVLVVSARGENAVKVRGLDLGAVDYLQKPYSLSELRARVERTLRLLRSQAALREQAQTDALTGLANLRAFRTRLDEESKRARRYHTPLTCVMADVDQLKPINDELGHAAGDRAIAAVAAVLREELRETDFGARYGGDEFVVLLPQTGADEGRVYAERVCARLRQTELLVGDRRVALTASLGVACQTPEHDEGPEALVHAADAALYVAKRAGGGRLSVAAP
jgi:two-component system, cell cycle response regulator